MTRRRVAVLISGRGSNMVSLIAAAQAPDFPAEIALVLSNRPDAGGLERARQAGIEALAIDHKAYPDRERFEQALDEALRARGIEFICLAGFMRVLTPWFVERWTGRMINVHPSLLPLFRGTHTHERALAEGVLVHGCTVHFVVPELDAGPIVAQAAVPVVPEDTPDSLAARVLAQEHRIYPEALRLICAGQARLDGTRTVFATSWDSQDSCRSPSF
jgi:phosphoribosylglycinamide formyltransferase 1